MDCASLIHATLSQLFHQHVAGFHQFADDAGFERGVAGVGDDAELRLGPDPGERPGGAKRRHHIIAAVDDHAGQVAELRGLLQQPAVLFIEALVVEVVALDAREGVEEVGLVEARRALLGAEDGEGFAFPARWLIGRSMFRSSRLGKSRPFMSARRRRRRNCNGPTVALLNKSCVRQGWSTRSSP